MYRNEPGAGEEETGEQLLFPVRIFDATVAALGEHYALIRFTPIPQSSHPTNDLYDFVRNPLDFPSLYICTQHVYIE
jgi:hypothetical protein